MDRLKTLYPAVLVRRIITCGPRHNFVVIKTGSLNRVFAYNTISIMSTSYFFQTTTTITIQCNKTVWEKDSQVLTERITVKQEQIVSLARTYIMYGKWWFARDDGASQTAGCRRPWRCRRWPIDFYFSILNTSRVCVYTVWLYNARWSVEQNFGRRTRTRNNTLDNNKLYYLYGPQQRKYLPVYNKSSTVKCW